MVHEKILCTSIMLCQITAILSGVAMLYLLVIVILPAKDELSMGISISPIMCSTIRMDDNALRPPNEDGSPAKCEWASCREWCLSKDPAKCLQIYVRPRFRGASVILEECEQNRFIDQVCSALNLTKARTYQCKKGECIELNGLFNCTRNEWNDCKPLYPAYECPKGSVDPEQKNKTTCTKDKCKKPLEGVQSCDEDGCNSLSRINSFEDCNRRCTDLDLSGYNNIIFSTEHLYAAKCKRVSTTNGTAEMKDLSNSPLWQNGNEPLLVFCTYVTFVNSSVLMEDCFNASLGDANTLRGIKDYRDLQNYHISSPERSDWLIDPEEQLRIANDTKLKFNSEGCSNTLSKKCTKFFRDHIQDERDGRTRQRYPCYYTKEHNDFVASEYFPEDTRLYLILASSVPSGLFILSCGCLFLCSKLVLTNDEGHLQFRSFKKDPLPEDASEL